MAEYRPEYSHPCSCVAIKTVPDLCNDNAAAWEKRRGTVLTSCRRCDTTSQAFARQLSGRQHSGNLRAKRRPKTAMLLLRRDPQSTPVLASFLSRCLRVDPLKVHFHTKPNLFSCRFSAIARKKFIYRYSFTDLAKVHLPAIGYHKKVHLRRFKKNPELPAR
jgi:hypothetical protein